MPVRVVDPDKIEGIVGVKRHKTNHYARAISEEESVYILHSDDCFTSRSSLLYCHFSKALAEGVNIADWQASLDRPVKVGFGAGGRLIPIDDTWTGQVG